MGAIAPSVLLAAVRRFPDRAERVVWLAGQSEPFLDMCEELAAAEEALAGLDLRPLPDADARRDECQGWIDRLTAEMSAAMRGASVLPLPVRRRP